MSADAHTPGRWRRVGWLVAILASFALVRWWLVWSDQPRDIRTISTYILLLLAWISSVAWFAVFSGYSARCRWLVGLLGGLAVLVAYFSVDAVNDGDAQLVGWRFVWQAKPDQQLPPSVAKEVADDWKQTPHDYPAFLGGRWWAEVSGVDLDADWKTHPPKLLWRQPIGAGWSAFAVVGDYAVTQEQHGNDECVTCYRVDTGKLVWSHSDSVRFDPATLGGGLGGVGPRATPAINGDRIYTQGATGIINCLDARTGDLVWQVDSGKRFGSEPLIWGKSSSPLVIPDRGIVVVAVGKSPQASDSDAFDASLVAFDIHTGEVKWQSGQRVTSYASPVLVALDSQEQIVQVNQDFITSHDVDDGQVLWEHPWPGSSSANASCSQPVPIDANQLLLSKGYGTGAELLSIKRNDSGTWQIDVVWKAPVLKTKFANVVCRDRYAYALDDISLQCVELTTGSVKWKKRRRPEFGHGQILLVGSHLLVLSETGECCLVNCSPNRYQELATFQALTDQGVTWNTPALSSSRLLVRNDLEAACYELPLSEPIQSANQAQPEHE